MTPREAYDLLVELAAARTAADCLPYLNWLWGDIVLAPIRALEAVGIPIGAELIDPEAPFTGEGLTLIDARLARWRTLAHGGLGAQVVTEALEEELGQALLDEAKAGRFHALGQLSSWWPPQQAIWAEGYWLAWCWAQAPTEATGFEVVALSQAARGLGLRSPACLEWAAEQAARLTTAGATLLKEAA